MEQPGDFGDEGGGFGCNPGMDDVQEGQPLVVNEAAPTLIEVALVEKAAQVEYDASHALQAADNIFTT